MNEFGFAKKKSSALVKHTLFQIFVVVVVVHCCIRLLNKKWLHGFFFTPFVFLTQVLTSNLSDLNQYLYDYEIIRAECQLPNNFKFLWSHLLTKVGENSALDWSDSKSLLTLAITLSLQWNSRCKNKLSFKTYCVITVTIKKALALNSKSSLSAIFKF